jgi:hypothetical protein
MAGFKTDSEGYLLDGDGKRQTLLGYPVKIVPVSVPAQREVLILESLEEGVVRARAGLRVEAERN